MEYYRLILYILFGILPSLVWLFYYLKKDLHPEPKKMILKIFFYGILITIPAFLIQITLAGFLSQLQLLSFFRPGQESAHFSVIIDILKWFFVIAATEEILKYLVIKFAVLKNRELDEPLDIMLYMVVVALGFAALENMLYLFSPLQNLSFGAAMQTTLAITFIRFIGATFLHTLCSALLGYFLALSFLRTTHRLQLTVTGILLAILLHGLYDFSIITLYGPLHFVIPILIIIGLAIFMVYDFDEIKKIKGICKL